MNGYICFWNKRRCEVYAENSYKAQQLAMVQFKCPSKKSYQIAVVLAEKDGKQVTTDPAQL